MREATEQTSAPPPGRLMPWLAGVCLVVAGARAWGAICLFVGEEWNDVRLRAAWLVRDGLPLYPGLDGGPATTWIYGPVTPLLMLPATLCSHVGEALLVAGLLNALLPAAAIALACLAWPAPAGAVWPLSRRLLALGIALLLVPEPYMVFLLVDNAVLACGLVSLTCLARAGDRDGVLAWLAAVFGAAAVFAKWHGVAVPAGSVVWLALATGPRTALRHAARCAGAGLVGVGTTLLLAASPRAAWEGLVAVAGHLPMIALARWPERLQQLAPGLGILLLLPTAVAAHQLRRGRWRASGLGLPVVVWLCSLPLGVAGMFTHGGHYNSLHGAFYLLPLAALGILDASDPAGRRMAWIALGVFALFRVAGLHALPSRPQVQLVTEATSLATAHGDRLWLPWRPLATRLATGRHDHDEDGLLVRQLAGHPVDGERLRAHLPAHWDSTFLLAGGMNWNLAVAHSPPRWVASRIGRWLIITGRADDSGVGKPPAGPHPPR